MNSKLAAERLLEEILDYATRVAFSMCKDPEMGSLAGRCAMKAAQTYDPSKGVPLKRWTARIVRKTVHYWWRERAKHPTVQKGEEWWEAVYRDEEAEGTIPVPRGTWTVLCERYIEKQSVAEMARARGISTSSMKLVLSVAACTLRDAVE